MNKGIYYSLFTALMWGFLAIGLKVASADVSPITIAQFRFTLAFTVLVVYYVLFDRDKLKILKRPPLLAVLAGAALGANYLGFNMGIYLTSPTVGQIFIQVGPVTLAIVSVIIFKERFSIRQGFGLFVVIVGMVIFYNESLSTILGDEIENLNSGILWLLFGGFSWVFYGVFQKKEVQKYDPMQLNLLIFGVPALLLVPGADYSSFSSFDFNQWLLMAYLGTNTLLAYGSLSFALKYLEANKVSVIVILNPLITFVAMAYLSYINVSWIETELFSTWKVIGAVTALVGIVVTVLKRKEV